jgi:hypothetical protein
VNLTVPITLTDELDDEIVTSTGSLDLARGEIRDVRYVDYDVATQGLPASREDYAFTSGTLSNDGKDVEFSVQVERFSGKYSVTPSELLDIKVRAARLFAGVEGRELAGGQAKSGGKKLH